MIIKFPRNLVCTDESTAAGIMWDVCGRLHNHRLGFRGLGTHHHSYMWFLLWCSLYAARRGELTLLGLRGTYGNITGIPWSDENTWWRRLRWSSIEQVKNDDLVPVIKSSPESCNSSNYLLASVFRSSAACQLDVEKQYLETDITCIFECTSN